jgi:hypothetical protein
MKLAEDPSRTRMAIAPSNGRSSAGRGEPFPACSLNHGCITMQDILWIATMLGLLAATLAYVRLCGRA